MVEACAARVREAADKEVCVGESTARTKWSEGEIDRFKGALARLGPSSNIKLEAEIRTRTAAQVNVFKYRFLKAYLTWLKDNYHPPPVSPLVRIQSDVQTPVIPPRRPPSQTSGGRRGASDARPSPRSSAPATCENQDQVRALQALTGLCPSSMVQWQLNALCKRDQMAYQSSEWTYAKPPYPKLPLIFPHHLPWHLALPRHESLPKSQTLHPLHMFPHLLTLCPLCPPYCQPPPMRHRHWNLG